MFISLLILRPGVDGFSHLKVSCRVYDLPICKLLTVDNTNEQV